MSLSTLPVELLENIFQPLPAVSLTTLALTSTAFYPTASRFLYHRVSVSSFARNLSAVKTLATRRHLALLVRHFSISLNDDGKDQVDGEYYTALCYALRGMDGLIGLELNVDGSSSWILAAASTPASSSPSQLYQRLEHFSCSFPLDAHTASFLERTPQLRSLQLGSSPHSVPLPPSALPRLTIYTGPSCLLPQVLPRRPIASLHLSGDLMLSDIEHLANVAGAPGSAVHGTSPEVGQSPSGFGATAKLQTLSAITSAPPVAVIEALSKACPSLVSLRVITTCAFWETPDITFYARIASCLSSLPSLSAFELSGMHWEFRPKTASAADGMSTASGKEWISPPVTPRAVDVEILDNQDREFTLDGAFLEWAY